MRAMLIFLGVACVSTIGHAGPSTDEAICGGASAIVATWPCDSSGDGYCTLWGVDSAHSGRWEEQSIFVVEGAKSVDRLAFKDACSNGRCSRPEYSVCSTPVSKTVTRALSAMSSMR